MNIHVSLQLDEDTQCQIDRIEHMLRILAEQFPGAAEKIAKLTAQLKTSQTSLDAAVETQPK